MPISNKKGSPRIVREEGSRNRCKFGGKEKNENKDQRTEYFFIYDP